MSTVINSYKFHFKFIAAYATEFTRHNHVTFFECKGDFKFIKKTVVPLYTTQWQH